MDTKTYKEILVWQKEKIINFMNFSQNISCKKSELFQEIIKLDFNTEEKITSWLIQTHNTLKYKEILVLDFISNNLTQEIPMLSDKSININFYFNGINPLHLASKNGNIITLKQLISLGADVNIEDNNNKTPLMIATYNNKTETAQLLLDNGSNANLLDNQQNSALTLAALKNYTLLTNLLFNYTDDIYKGNINHNNIFQELNQCFYKNSITNYLLQNKFDTIQIRHNLNNLYIIDNHEIIYTNSVIDCLSTLKEDKSYINLLELCGKTYIEESL